MASVVAIPRPRRAEQTMDHDEIVQLLSGLAVTQTHIVKQNESMLVQLTKLTEAHVEMGRWQTTQQYWTEEKTRQIDDLEERMSTVMGWYNEAQKTDAGRADLRERRRAVMMILGGALLGFLANLAVEWLKLRIH